MNNAIDNALEAIRHANPVPDPVDLADVMLRSDVFLTTTKEISMSIDTDQPTHGTPAPKPSAKRRNVLVFVGAFAVAVVAVALLATVNTDDDITAVGAAPALTVDGALAVSDGYIEAFNAGDADTVLALLTSDVALSEKYTGMSPSFETMDHAFFEQRLAWDTAQGATFTSPECVVTDEGTGAAVTVSCEFGWLYAAEAAVGLPPVPTVLTMVVTRSGISQAAFEYPPDFGVGSFGAGSDGRGTFDVWVVANHADDMEGIEFGDWDSVAAAEQGGILLALYVEEWAAFLETRG